MSLPPVVGFAGVAGSGKDTAAAALVDALGFRRVGFADALKDLLFELDPWVKPGGLWSSAMSYREALHVHGPVDVKHRTDARDFMVRLGAGAREVLGPDVWVDVVRRQIEAEPGVRWAISDVRYANERRMIEELGGRVLLVERPGLGPANDEERESLAAMSFGGRDVLVNDGDVTSFALRVAMSTVGGSDCG